MELMLTVRQAFELYQERKKLNLLADLVENAKYVMIFIVQPDGRIIECNALATRTFGYTKSQMLGRDVSVLFKPDSMPEDAKTMNEDSHWAFR